jgi:hypothetical protein
VTGRSRAAAVVAGSVAELPAGSLAEVIQRAALPTREDRTYLVPVDRFAELVARLPGAWVVLEIDRRRGFAYESVYFDTPDLLLYRQHVQGRRRRYKVRTRAYLDSGDCAFEVKLKDGRDRTVKARLPYPIADRAHLCPLARVPGRPAPSGLWPARTPAGRERDHRLPADDPGRPRARRATHL